MTRARFIVNLSRAFACVIAAVGVLAFSSAARAGVFSIQTMSGDATSGIDAAKTYTHAFDLNRGGTDPLGGNDALALSINGVPFTGITSSAGGVDVNHGGAFTATGINAVFNNHNPGVTGGVGDLLDDFFHNGNGAGGATPGTETITLTGLTPGKVYKTVYYVGGFGTNAQAISFSDTGATINNIPRNGGTSPGARIEYLYEASPAGSITYTFDANANNDSFHQYGFTNELTGYRAITGLFNTGVDNGGALLPDSVDDPHYVIIAQPSPGGLVDATIPADGFPIGPWLGNSAVSRWIAPNTNDGNGPAGQFIYRTTFEIPNDLSASTAILGGAWASDDAAVNIFINGIPTGLTNTGFGALVPFTISSGFVPGVNTIDFVVNNGGNGPTGLRVEGLTAFALPIPEPATATLALFALGGLLRRRRRAV